MRETGEPAPDALCYNVIAEYQDLLHQEKKKQSRSSVSEPATDQDAGDSAGMQVDV